MEALTPYRASYLMPPLARAVVTDAMHFGVIAVPPDCDAETVARTMATRRVHAVVVEGITSGGGGERLVWGLITDLDLARAIAGAGDVPPTAGELATTEIVTVGAGDGLEHAARLMAEHGVSHLIVTTAASGRPVGVVSALDIAAAFAWGER